MFGDMFSKIKQQMEESKRRLDSMTVEAESEGGLVKVSMTGNRKLKSISIDDKLLTDNDKEALEDLIVVAVNRASEKAEKLFETEIQSSARGMFPGFPGMF